MLIMGLDTSGGYASCALCSEDRVLALNTLATKRAHSQVILPMMKKMLSDTGHGLADIDGFAVINGPGSYSGLRIGISAVKGICFGLDKKCAGVSALEAMAYNFAFMRGTPALIVPVMHARQELYYTAVFRAGGGVFVRESEDNIRSLDEIAADIRGCSLPVYITGDSTDTVISAVNVGGGNFAVMPAGAFMGTPSAASICFAAMGKEFTDPDELLPEYMQITKAEKDLLEKDNR